MHKKTVFLTILLILIPLPFCFQSLQSHRRYTGDSTAGLAPMVLAEESMTIPQQSADSASSRKRSETVSKVPSLEPKGPPSKHPDVLPARPVPVESAVEVQVPNLPPAVLPSQHKSMVKFCGGEPISQCENVEFTHCDLALLLLDILALGERQTYEDAFEVLESRAVSPVIGWAKDNPQKRMTSREMEEVRCSISLAYEEGLIEERASIVTVALNRFCVELEVSLKALKDSGVLKDRSYYKAETGYQGGGDGVSSPSF